MATTTIPRYVDISAKAYEHPADRAATAALGTIPLLKRVLSKLSELQVEKPFQQLLLADSVRLSEHQLPEVYAAHLEVSESLDLDYRPELYLKRMTDMNAMTVGSAHPIVIVNSSLVTAIPSDRLRVVLAHEAGHVLSDHVHYSTVLRILQQILATGLAPTAMLPLQAVTLVLLEWQRCAELSSDRAASLVVEDPLLVCRTLLDIAGGGVAGLDLDAFITQAEEWHGTDDLLSRPGRWVTELTRTHPYSVRRVAELTRWVREGDYDRIRSGNYVRRGQEPPPSAQVRAATEHYRQRFTEILDRVAGGVQRTADTIATWLRGQNREGDVN